MTGAGTVARRGDCVVRERNAGAEKEMRVKVRFTGMIRHYVGEKEREYELPEGSTAGDLLRLLGRDYGPCMPAQMWDSEREKFHPLVIAMRKGEPLAGGNGPLRDGDEIFLLSRLAGG